MTTVAADISVHDLHNTLRGETEFALLDVREQEEFSRAHILLACCAPLSRLELMVERLVPCKKTPVFVMTVCLKTSIVVNVPPGFWRPWATALSASLAEA